MRESFFFISTENEGLSNTRSNSSVKDVWGERKPFRGFGSWPSRVDYNLVVDEDQVDEWKASACVMCSIGCGIDIAVKDKKSE